MEMETPKGVHGMDGWAAYGDGAGGCLHVAFLHQNLPAQPRRGFSSATETDTETQRDREREMAERDREREVVERERDG